MTHTEMINTIFMDALDALRTSESLENASVSWVSIFDLMGRKHPGSPLHSIQELLAVRTINWKNSATSAQTQEKLISASHLPDGPPTRFAGYSHKLRPKLNGSGRGSTYH